MSANSFRPQNRIKKSKEFSEIFSRGRYKLLGNKYIHLQYLTSDFKYARLGLILSRKVSKKAVVRNKIKRIIREWFRTNKNTLPPYDFIFLIRKSFDKKDFLSIREELNNFISKLNNKN